MREIATHYIGGAFVSSSGGEIAPLFNPATEEQIGSVRLADSSDIDHAVSAAVQAFPVISGMSVPDRASLLRNVSATVSAHADRMADAMREEYGAPSSFVEFCAKRSGSVFLDMAQTIESYAWRRDISAAVVEMLPVGVAAAITPWNSNYGFICGKLATAIAAGTSIVIKPSEMSASQTQVIAEALHEAGLPRGVLNIVNGTGAVAGDALVRHRDIAKVSFTGSTATGRSILRGAAETMKRVTLELGGKGAQILLDDADLDAAARQILANGLLNSAQACIAGTRVLVPAHLVSAIEERLVAELVNWPVGPATDQASRIGPMVSAKQWERVQSYIRLGSEAGAVRIAGGEGRPDGIERGWFVRPTLFSRVDNDMRIAREEIFGPVLSIICYKHEDDAVRIANDTEYGLQNYVLGADLDRAKQIASRLVSGRVLINAAPHEPLAPFGGFKQSGIGREFGAFGLEAFLEPRTTLA